MVVQIAEMYPDDMHDRQASPDIPEALTSQVASAHPRADLKGWRILASISGGLFLATFVLLEWMWRATAGDVAGRNAFGALAVLVGLPLLVFFGVLVASLIGLGIKSDGRERILSWLGATALVIWIGWLLSG